MQIFITEPKLAAVVALEGLQGRTVEIQTTDNKSIVGKVSGVAVEGLNLNGTSSVSFADTYRLRVTG